MINNTSSQVIVGNYLRLYIYIYTPIPNLLLLLLSEIILPLLFPK